MTDSELSDFQVEFVRDEAAFAALATAWRALERRCGEALSALGFDETWRAWTLVARPLGARLAIVVGRQDGAVVLIWPLVRRGRMVEALGGNPSGPNDILLAPDPCQAARAEAAWQAMRRALGGSCLVLRGVPETSPILRLGGHRRRFRAQHQVWIIRLADWGGWERYEKHLPRRLLADQRRQWRRVAELEGEVRFRRARTRDEAAAQLEAYTALKQHWLAARGISNQQFSPGPYRDFEQANRLALFDAGKLLVGRLGSEEATLSVGYGIVRGERFLFEGFVYDQRFARLSPSRLLLEHLVRWCFEQRLEVFDFLPGDVAYKQQWGEAREAVFEQIMPLDAWGQALAMWHHGGLRRLARLGWLRAAYRRLPRRLRHAAQRLLLPGMDYAAKAKHDHPA